MYSVVVIGAGLAGIAAAARLRAAGITDFVVLERADRVGGVWRDTVYPGAEVDVPSWLYCLSFAAKPDWTKVNAGAPEILAYIEDVVEQLGISPHLRFDSEVVRAEYGTGYWTVATANGESVHARTVIAADGVLSNARYPTLEGMETYTGQRILSSCWPAGFDVTGRRVAVVGTGASAAQIVPALVARAAHVTVFQRTPAWALPRPDTDVPAPVQRLLAKFPVAQRMLRWLLFLIYELLLVGATNLGPLTSFFEAVSRRHLRNQVHDPDLRTALTPTYRIGCKRPLVTSTFYPALQQENCTLVPHAVVGLTAGGLAAADGSHHAADCVVFATGYDVHNRGAAFTVIGRDGHVLADEWRDGMVGYKSVSVAGYPNLFWAMGPNSFGHSSLLLFIEEQVDYAVRCIREILDNDITEFDVRPEAQARFNERLQHKLRTTTFGSGCHSWYLNRSGQNCTAFPGTVTAYRRQMRVLDLHDYVTVPAPDRIPQVMS